MTRRFLPGAICVALTFAAAASSALAAQEQKPAGKTAASKTTPSKTPSSKTATSKAAPSKSDPEKDERKPGRYREVGERTSNIVSQPVRDVGISKTEIPPVLVAASAAPYSLQGIKTCRQISAAMLELNTALGDDFAVGEQRKENRAGKLAEAGGKTVVNSLIPYRTLVREISGAAPAQRRREAAIDAGYARRGFLRGVHQTRKCRTSL